VSVHELSICRSIFTIADRARQGRRVDVIHLQVGHLRQIVPQTLEHCWRLVTERTDLQGSRLDIEHVPAQLSCGDCHVTTTAAHNLVLTCAACGSGRITVTHGEEFMLTSMDLGGAGDG
jgi:hydrogenase nickel incorporation protein HypA/HybF